MRASAALIAYVRERYAATLFVPLAVFIGVASLAMANSRPTLGLLVPTAVASALAYVLVFQFRLWDDLADRESDRLRCPERVLARFESRSPFVAFLIGTIAVNLLLVAVLRGAGARWMALAGLDFAMLAWYRWGRRGVANVLLSYHGVLAKYPVLVFVVSPVDTNFHGARAALVALFVYLCFCVYEVLDDSRLRAAAGARYALGVEVTLLAVVAGLLWRQALGLGAPAVAGLVALAAALAVCLFTLRVRRRISPYAIFGFGIVELGTLTLGGQP